MLPGLLVRAQFCMYRFQDFCNLKAFDIVTGVTKLKLGCSKAQQLLRHQSSVLLATLKVFTKRVNVQRYRPNFLQVGIET